MFLFEFSFLFYFVFHIKKIKELKNTKTVYVYIGTYVPWMAIETKFSKLCISLAYLSSSSASFYHNLDSFSIAPRSIKKVSISLIAPRSIELVLLWTLVDSCSIAVSLLAFKARHLLTLLDLLRIMSFL